MPGTHRYALTVRWTGNRGSGTSGYRDYHRDHEVLAPGKPVLAGSSDAAFRGDPTRWTPEELLVAALSQCHMLWFLHLASRDRVVVTGYVDTPAGTMVEHADGGGEFVEVVLSPQVTVAEPGMVDPAQALHGPAHRLCFIARSVAFPVRHRPTATARG
jgi:organic hydroperoxide reductase OsmC/OhrA